MERDRPRNAIVAIDGAGAVFLSREAWTNLPRHEFCQRINVRWRAPTLLISEFAELLFKRMLVSGFAKLSFGQLSGSNFESFLGKSLFLQWVSPIFEQICRITFLPCSRNHNNSDLYIIRGCTVLLWRCLSSL